MNNKVLHGYGKAWFFMNTKVIFVCEDSVDGILTAVYHAWIVKNQQQKTGKMNIELICNPTYNYEIFAEYKVIDTDLVISEKVLRSIRKDFSYDTYLRVYRAAMSYNEHKANIIFRFLIDAYRVGQRIEECLSFSSVMDLYELDRNVMYEQHHYLGFVRFAQIGKQLLFSEIEPKNNILTLIAPHFSDRLSMESWIIYDKNRKQAAIHESNKGWMLVSNEEINTELVNKVDCDEEEVKNLWKLFYRTIAIQERTNPKLQRNNMPLRFRNHITECE